MYVAATFLAVVLSVAGDTDGLATRLEPIYQSLLRNFNVSYGCVFAGLWIGFNMNRKVISGLCNKSDLITFDAIKFE
jgi:hypothetical protein